MISWHNPTAEIATSAWRITFVRRAGRAESGADDRAGAQGQRRRLLPGWDASVDRRSFLARRARRCSIGDAPGRSDRLHRAGELTLFIDDSQLNYLEDIMWDQGYLDTKQMAGVFQILQSNDLIWSRMVQEYLMGQHALMIDTDLMAWNADTTRMPYRMHSEYLRRLFLNNNLFEGRYQVDGRPVVLSDIRAPIFAVTTEADHVAPWCSVYKINLVSDTDVTFLLTSGGHNAGIVSEPGQNTDISGSSHRPLGETNIDPDTWYLSNPSAEGSWWPVWAEWLESKSTGRATPPALGAPDKGYPPLGAAPGQYVLER